MLMLIVLMLLGGCGKKGTLTLPEKPQTENSASVGKTDRYSQSNPLTDLKPSQTTQQETP